MRERILKFIETEGISAAEFADHIGVQRSNVSHVLNGRNNPGFSFIQKILETFPNVNPRWLLTGSGDIYENPVKKSSPASVSPNLFSTTETKTEIKPKPLKEEQIKSEITESQNIPDEIVAAPAAQPNDKTVVRVLIFYHDHTFEDFRPAK